MKNRNTQLTAVLFVVALALAPIVQATPEPQGGPTRLANDQLTSDSENLAVVSIYSTGNVARGNIGSFVLRMDSPNSPLNLGGMYVNFTVGGTAIPGVDYVALVSPAFIGQSGYGTILVKTLPNRRAAADQQAYSVVVKITSGAGYAAGAPSSATMWIKPCAGCGLANW
jgi:hypothetical protein